MDKSICVFTLASDFAIYYKIIDTKGNVSEEMYYRAMVELDEQHEEFDVEEEILRFKEEVAFEYDDVQFVGIHEEY